MSKPISFGIIGFGWRAEAYLRIAKQLPHVFKISGIVVRNPSKYVEAAKSWDVTLYESSYEMAHHIISTDSHSRGSASLHSSNQ